MANHDRFGNLVDDEGHDILEDQELELDPIDEDEDDHQPTEYEEWQDVYGGDDWDHGQFENDSDLWNEY